MNIYLRRGREQRVLGGHPWVFRSDIEREDGAADGLPVRVLTSAGRFLAMAVYNPRSQISLRILSRRDEPIDAAFIRGRVRRALDYRRRFADLNSCRLIFAESDGLPAVIADKFGEVIVLQILCLGMERFKGDIVDALAQELSPRGIYERNDVPVRELEGLTQQTGLLFGEVPDRVEMQENGVRFLVDVKEGQKTGFFLDQKENRAVCAGHAGAGLLHAHGQLCPARGALRRGGGHGRGHQRARLRLRAGKRAPQRRGGPRALRVRQRLRLPPRAPDREGAV